ncbi:hypothetical protein, partial [uncultured Bacteroides sp.]|uniref:hypothetical protein n=1 Tax=uncultured Bacteroides sp. TaxID=162156 RepID=UPI002615FDCD
FPSFFPVCFPLFIRHIARYASHKNRKTSSKRTLKKNYTYIKKVKNVLSEANAGQNLNRL